MDTYLEDNPPKHRQYRDKRRAQVTGAIVLHTAENSPDTVVPDRGAETVARFISVRGESGSYHSVVDSENIVHVMPYEWEAFHEGTGGNRWSLGLTFATRSSEWQKLPSAWVDNVISNGAAEARAMAEWVKETTGVVVPAKRITAEEYRAHKPGFVTHSDLDPGRRTDPGSKFPWQDFLEQFEKLGKSTSAKPRESKNDDTNNDGVANQTTGDGGAIVGKAALVKGKPTSKKEDADTGGADTPADGDVQPENETLSANAGLATNKASPGEGLDRAKVPEGAPVEEASTEKAEANLTADVEGTPSGVDMKPQLPIAATNNADAPSKASSVRPGAYSFAMDDVDELYRAYKGNRPASVLRRAIARDLARRIFVDGEDPQSFVSDLHGKLAAESPADVEQVKE